MLGEQALCTTVGGPDVMAGQLRHLLAIGFGNLRLSLGIIPRRAEFVYTTTCFALLDQHMAEVETISAEFLVTAPRELAYYEKVRAALSRLAVHGTDARVLITEAIEALPLS